MWKTFNKLNFSFFPLFSKIQTLAIDECVKIFKDVLLDTCPKYVCTRSQVFIPIRTNIVAFYLVILNRAYRRKWVNHDFLSSLFSRLFKSWFPHVPGHSGDNAIDHGEHLKHCDGRWSQCNPFYSNQNSLHYIRRRHRSAHPFVFFFLQRNDDNRGKKSHQISLATVNSAYFHQGYCNEEMVIRRQWFTGVSRMVGIGKKTTKKTHTQTWVRQMWAATASNCS